MIYTFILTLLLTFSSGDYYKLYDVKKVDDNLYVGYYGYQKVFVQTEYCHYDIYPFKENAVLIWGGKYSYGNKIIWENDTYCRVELVFTKN